MMTIEALKKIQAKSADVLEKTPVGTEATALLLVILQCEQLILMNKILDRMP